MVGIWVEGNNKSGVVEFAEGGSSGGFEFELVEVEEEESEPVEPVAWYSISVR